MEINILHTAMTKRTIDTNVLTLWDNYLYSLPFTIVNGQALEQKTFCFVVVVVLYEFILKMYTW